MKITSNIEDMIRQVDNLSNMPGPKTRLRLDEILHRGFILTQFAVHIDTLSLKPSGKVSSRQLKASWRGEIVYGGSSPGPNNPVDYAIYEQRRGGEHNFMLPLKELHPLIVKTIIKGMKEA